MPVAAAHEGETEGETGTPSLSPPGNGHSQLPQSVGTVEKLGLEAQHSSRPPLMEHRMPCGSCDLEQSWVSPFGPPRLALSAFLPSPRYSGERGTTVLCYRAPNSDCLVPGGGEGAETGTPSLSPQGNGHSQLPQSVGTVEKPGLETKHSSRPPSWSVVCHAERVISSKAGRPRLAPRRRAQRQHEF